MSEAAAVFVVRASPAPPEGVLLSASFRAAAERFGVGAVEDVAGGPALTAVLLLGAVPAEPAAEGAPSVAALLEADIEAALSGAGHPAGSVLVRRLDTPLDAPLDELGILDEAIDHWVGRLREETTISADRRAFRQAIEDLLLGERARTLFQPIVSLEGGDTVAFEALTRGPAHHHLESAEALLEAVQRAGMEAEAYRAMIGLARRRATSALAGGDYLLFVNVGPQRTWGPRSSLRLDEGPGASWPWDRTVVELTEQAPIDDIPGFLRVRDSARERGVRFALDDVGAGYAGLTTLAVVNPDYLKIDKGLVQGCDRDSWRQAIIESLLHLADRAGASVIAEGVERAAELECLAGLGVPLAQGYLLGMPANPPFVFPTVEAAGRPQRRAPVLRLPSAPRGRHPISPPRLQPLGGLRPRR